MKNIIKFFVLDIFLMIFLCGCYVTTAYLNQGVQKYTTTQKNTIKIFSERHIAKDFVEIGYVAVHHTQTQSGDDLKDLVKEKASSLGADAVIDFKIFGLTAGGIAVKYK
jgi:hypothetical protein